LANALLPLSLGDGAGRASAAGAAFAFSRQNAPEDLPKPDSENFVVKWHEIDSDPRLNQRTVLKVL